MSSTRTAHPGHAPDANPSPRRGWAHSGLPWLGTAVAIAFLMLVAAGCGGSSDESSSASETTTSAETTTVDTGTSTEQSTGTTGSTDRSAAPTDACTELDELGQKYSAALAQATSGTDASLGAIAVAISQLSSEVPDELQGDFKTIAGGIAAYAKAVQGLHLKPGDTPTPAQIAAITKAAKTFSTGEVGKAVNRVSAWVSKNCGTAVP